MTAPLSLPSGFLIRSPLVPGISDRSPHKLPHRVPSSPAHTTPPGAKRGAPGSPRSALQPLLLWVKFWTPGPEYGSPSSLRVIVPVTHFGGGHEICGVYQPNRFVEARTAAITPQHETPVWSHRPPPPQALETTPSPCPGENGRRWNPAAGAHETGFLSSAPCPADPPGLPHHWEVVLCTAAEGPVIGMDQSV